MMVAQDNAISAIPFPDLLKVSSLVNPNREKIKEVLDGYTDDVIDKLVALLNGQSEPRATSKSNASKSDTAKSAAAVSNESPEPEMLEPVQAAADPVEPTAAPQPETMFEPQPSESPKPPVKQSLFQDPEPQPEPQPAPKPKKPKAGSLAAQLKAIQDAKEERLKRVDPDDFEDIERGSFAKYDWSASEKPQTEVMVDLENLHSATDDTSTPTTALVYWGGISVPEDHEVLYLLVADDLEQERSPESGHQLVITRGTAFRDTIDESAGMRHYMVWAYVAPRDNIALFLEVQPIFVGEKAIALPPSDLKVVESNGVVNGTWTPKRGHAKVMVFVRQSLDRRDLDSPENCLKEKVDGRGFNYTVPVRGATYDFQLFPEIEFRGNMVRGSGGEVKQLTISADIQQIELLEASLIIREAGSRDAGNDTIVLRYIHPPTGEVKIYLTQTEPAPDLIGQEVDNSYIGDDDALGTTQWSLTSEGNPGEEITLETMWPGDWSQVYCVPVNVVGEKSMVGEPKQIRRVASIKDFDLIQRVDSQLITFDWPSGAQMVEVQQEQKPVQELIEDDYRRQGGIRLHLNPLQDHVTLLPKAIHEGKYTKADHPTTKTYPGLKLYSYMIDVPPGPGPVIFPKLWIWREDLEERSRGIEFKLVYRPDRLPLHVDDGEAIKCVASNDQQGDAPGTPSYFLTPESLAKGKEATRARGEYWLIELRSEGPRTSGFIRLFIQPKGEDAPQDKVASRVLIDDDAIAALNLDDGLWSGYFHQRGY